MNSLLSRAVLILTVLAAALPGRMAADQSNGRILSIQLPGPAEPGAAATPGPALELTLEQLRSLPVARIRTTTHWTSGLQQFEGVHLFTLLRYLGIQSGQIELLAINDYSVTIPVAEIMPEGALLAFLRNGEPMSPRDKGPIWVVFDYDGNAAFRTETVFSRSIWQLDRIIVSR